MVNNKLVTPMVQFLHICTLNKMDFGNLIISCILVVVYFLLFGLESIQTLLQEEMSISHSEEEPQNIKAPGNLMITLRFK